MSLVECACVTAAFAAASEVECHRLLCRMRMRRAGVALELLQHRVAERTLGQHALDGLLEHAPRKARLHLAERARRDPARVAAVTVVELVVGLAAGHADLLDVGDD